MMDFIFVGLVQITDGSAENIPIRLPTTRNARLCFKPMQRIQIAMEHMSIYAGDVDHELVLKGS
jgi:hypothetical protein